MDEDKLGDVYTLLNEHWKLPEPDLVLSVTSGKLGTRITADMRTFMVNLMESTKNLSNQLICFLISLH